MTVEQATPPVATCDASPERPANLRVVWLMVAATFVVFLNETTMSVALRPIMLDLGVEARTGQWLTTAFMLTMAVVIPVTGFLIQRLNTRPVFVMAMALFSSTCARCRQPLAGCSPVGWCRRAALPSCFRC